MMKKFNSIFLAVAAMVFVSNTVVAQEYRFDPPWNTPPESEVQFTVPGVDNVPDLFGDINDPQLVVFFAGNQFMVIDELISAFKKKHPQYQRACICRNTSSGNFGKTDCYRKYCDWKPADYVKTGCLYSW
ncbi:hypothetical protein [Pedobacter sp. NJ-S-72]